MTEISCKSGVDFVQLCAERRSQLKKAQAPLPMASSPNKELPDGWLWASLSSLCERVSVGHVGPTSDFFSDDEAAVPLVRSQDVRPGKLQLAGCAKITPEFHNSLKKSQLKSGDVLVVRVGANRGDCCVVPVSVGALNCANIVFARPFFPNGYLSYYLRSPNGQSSLLALTTGAAQGVLNTQSIAALPVPVPPFDTQRRIASILSAYDDLIENNTRRIAILEEMARRIYEEWFVHFRFPGHEQVAMVESKLGLIPEGWEITNLDSVAEYINRGLTPKYDDMAEGLVINQKCIRGQKLSYELARKQSKPIPVEKRIRYGDVVINSTGVGTLGRVAQVLDERANCTADTHVTIVRPGSRVKIHFFGMALLALEQYFEQQGVGATGQTELGRNRVAETDFVLPPYGLQEKFDELVVPMRGLAIKLATKNANLRATRDLLLPKLISGEIDVSTLPEPEEVITA